MGSSPGRRPEYRVAAQQLGVTLARQRLGMVYGGGNIGLMGVTADASLAHGGRVIGIITQSLKNMEVAHENLSELLIVDSMHERKAAMAARSDGFIALPGGLGTLDEFFEIITWAQLVLHNKPCGLLNIAGYFDGLLQFLDHSVNEHFVRPTHRENLIVAEDPATLIDRMQQYEAGTESKWLDR
jgi:uncharacterized protein (TIGR00730 family)